MAETLGSGVPGTAVPRSSLERVRAAVDSLGLRVKDERSNGFMASCPVHEDRTPSLHVTWKPGHNGGLVLLNCHGHCETPAVVEALGLTFADLFDEPLPERERSFDRSSKSVARRRAGQRRGKLGRLPALLTKVTPAEVDDVHHQWVEVARYPYVDLDGRLVQEVIRQECTAEGGRHKTFRQEWLTRDGSRLKTKPPDFTPVLYRAPEVARAVRDGVEVWVLEGEKDVDRAVESFGLVATTNAQGGASFPDELVDALAGARVAVVLDRDATGWARGVHLYEKLTAVDATVRLLLPVVDEPKADFSDHVDAGGGLEDFIEVSVERVRVWHDLESALTRAKAKARTVGQAVAEARARWELAEAGQDVDDNRRVAQRWVLESQIRFEGLVDVVTTLQGYALRAGTEWAGAAVSDADELLGEAATAVRRVHNDVGVAVPELLLPRPAVAPAAAGHGEGDAEPDVPDGVAGKSEPAGLRSDTAVFRVIDDAIYQWDPTRTRRRGEDGDEDEAPGKWRRLLSMVVRVSAREYLEVDEDDEVDTTELMGRSSSRREKAQAPRTLAAMRLRYTDPVSGELMEIRVSADRWRDHSWLEALPGKPDYDHKRTGLDTLQRAILAISDDVVDEVLHRATGWRQGPAGFYYVHARGAITADGHRHMETSFSGPISRFDLPDPVRDPGALRQAWLTCSATMLDRLPGRVAAPLLGHVFRAAMGTNPWNVALIGSPGTFKTSIASKAMHHFGERWDQNSPLSSMSGNGATLNASRQMLHLAKDALAWLDDFAPTKSWVDAQKLLEETSRLIYNREARARSSRDGQEVMPGTAPRTSGLFTSEVMPRPGSSGGERMLVVPLNRGDVDPAQLFPLDEPPSRHGRALVMASFISWLAGDLRSRRAYYLQLAEVYASDLVAGAGEAVRQASAIAHTWIGWVAMCDFLTEAGAITADERAATLQRVDQHLHEAGKAAVDPDTPRTTGARVRELLGYALRNGIAYVDDVRTGDSPPWPLASRLGWRRTCVAEASDGVPAKYRLDRGGIRLGYVLHDPGPRERRGRVLMCEPSQVEAVIKAAAATQVEKLEIDWKTAARALYDDGILLGDTSEPGRVRMVLSCRLYAEDNRDARMAVLRLDEIIGLDDESSDPDTGPGSGPDYDGGPYPGDSPAPGGRAVQTIPGVVDLAPHLVDDDEHRGQDLPTDRDQLGSDHPHEELDMSYPTGPGDVLCVECGYPTTTYWPAGNPRGGDPMHVSCWRQLVSEGVIPDDAEPPDRPAETTTPATASAVPTPAVQAPARGGVAPAAVPAAASTPEQPTPSAPPATTGKGAPQAVGKDPTRRGKTIETAGAPFRAAAAIVDVDGIWLSNGERLAWFTRGLPEHVGQLQHLAEYLGLGTQTTKYLTEGGQVWIGAGLARHMGIDVDAIEAAADKDKDRVVHEVTSQIPAVTAALEAGHQLGGTGTSLGRWTRVWKDSSKSVWLVLLPALTRDPSSMGLMAGDPDHAALARRIGLLATALGAPFHHSASSTGLDLMMHVRRRDHEKFFAVTEPVEPATIGNLETETNWCRKPGPEELAHRWVHAYDRSGSYLAGAAGLELGIGEPVHHPTGTPFMPRVPGYWLIEVPPSGDWRMPHPLDWRGKTTGRRRWMTTPTLEFAFEQEYAPEILEAWTWPERARVLDPWYERVRDARTRLDSWDPERREETDPDRKAALAQLKQIYAQTIGMLGSETYRSGKQGYRPDWRHHIVAKARTNVLRRIAKIGKETGRWPVAVATDTVVYTSNEPDPYKAWPGGEKTLGRALGQYKPEGSALLADHLQYLTGGTYTGRSVLVDRDEDEAYRSLTGNGHRDG